MSKDDRGFLGTQQRPDFKLSDCVTVLIAANSLIALFLFSVSVQNVDLAMPLLKQNPPPSIFTTLFVGVFTYGSIITAFRSIYTLFKAMEKKDAEAYTIGYHLFVVVLIMSTLLICGIAASLEGKVSGHTNLPWQPVPGPQEPFFDRMLLFAFLIYVGVVVWKPKCISRLLHAVGMCARRLHVHPQGRSDRPY